MKIKAPLYASWILFPLTLLLVMKEVVTSRVSTTCPPGCDCDMTTESGVTINCTGCGFTSLEGLGFDKNTTNIYFDGNNIIRLSPTTFQDFTNLRILTLSKNHVRRIERGTFRRLTHLRKVDLSNNSISKLPSDLFSNQQNLELDLRGNKELDCLSFQDDLLTRNQSVVVFCDDCPVMCKCSIGQPRRVSVECVEANLKQVPRNIPRGTDTIILSFNGIQELNEMQLNYPDMGNVRKLKLDNNNISKIEDRSFTGLTQLEDLDLSFNKITQLPLKAFAKLTKLKWLNLQRNLGFDCVAFKKNYQKMCREVEVICDKKDAEARGTLLHRRHLKRRGLVKSVATVLPVVTVAMTEIQTPYSGTSTDASLQKTTPNPEKIKKAKIQTLHLILLIVICVLVVMACCGVFGMGGCLCVPLLCCCPVPFDSDSDGWT